MVPRAYNDNNGQDDMAQQERLVGQATDVQPTAYQQNTDSQGSNGTPDSVRQLLLGRICFGVNIQHQRNDRVDDYLDPENARDPPVQQQERGV